MSGTSGKHNPFQRCSRMSRRTKNPLPTCEHRNRRCRDYSGIEQKVNHKLDEGMRLHVNRGIWITIKWHYGVKRLQESDKSYKMLGHNMTWAERPSVLPHPTHLAQKHLQVTLSQTSENILVFVAWFDGRQNVQREASKICSGPSQ